jgi:hypothetical protein
MVIAFRLKDCFVGLANERSGFPFVEPLANLQREVKRMGDNRCGIARTEVRTRDDDARIRDRLNDSSSVARLYAAKLGQCQRDR